MPTGIGGRMTIDPGSKIGLFGGSFNPIHIGHIHVAQQVMGKLGLDGVWFIPAGNHPQRESKYSKLRMKILRESLKIDSRFRIIDYEVKKKDKGYTYKTITYLRMKYPNCEFILILGADQAQKFSTWKCHEAIVRWCRAIAVVGRKGFKMPISKQMIKVNVNVPVIDLSSTMIRNLVNNKEK